MKDDPFKSKKLEKTGDHTFRVETEGAGYFECTSKEKLLKFSKMKNKNQAQSENVMCVGIGTKKDLFCDSCKKKVTKVQGRFDQKFKKILYYCLECK